MTPCLVVRCSILDQQQKQTIAFSGGRLLGEFDGRIFVASNKEVLTLVPVAVEKQVSGESTRSNPGH